MSVRRRALPALVAAALAAAAPASQAAQFSGVYVFGDSLSDAGFYRPFLAGLGLPSSLVSTLGRFTTNPGPVWSEIVTQYYGYTPAPSNAGGNIFAQGGARVTADSASTPPGFAQRPVSTQINEYLARTGNTADPNALYAVWGGGNDFLQGSQQFATGAITQAQFQGIVVGAATAQVQQIARLRGAGARYILAFGLPDLGLTPSSAAGGAASVAGATALAAGFNTTLFTGLASAGIRAIPVDSFALITDVKNNAAAFGITNTTGIACGPFPPITTSGNSQFCTSANLVSANANNTFLFADGVHPTSVTHRILGDYVVQLIEGPTQYGLLAEAAVHTRGSHMRMLNDGLAQNRGNDVGKLNAFVATDVQDVQIDSSAGNTGIDGRVRTHALGLTVRASEAVSLGVAYGQGFHTGSFGLEAGNYKLKEKVWSVFGALKWGGFYGNAVASYADLDFNEVKRNIKLDTVRRTAFTNPQGTNGSFSLAAGYDFAFGRFQVGPTLAATTQDVTVNGFDESATEAGSAALRIYEQKRKSEVWSVGVRASAKLGDWTPWVRVTADKERRDQARFVSATPMSLAAIGNTYDIQAYAPDTKFTTMALGVNGWILPNVGLSAGYYKVSSRSGMKEDGLNVLLSMKF